jgi:competence protein ComEC
MLFASAVTSLIAGLATAPFSAFHFNRLSLYGVAANLLVTPVVSFVIMPSGVLALMVMPLGIEAFPLGIMEWGLEVMLAIAAWVAAWPGAVIPLASFPVSALVAISMGGIWLTIWQAPWRWFGLLPVMLGLVICVTTSQPDVIVSGSGHNAAIVGHDGRLKFLSARRERFDAGIWLSASGDSRDLARALQERNGGFDCSSGQCLALSGSGHWIAVANGPGAMDQACGYADVLVLPDQDKGEGCASSMLVIDRAMLSREGAISIWFDGPHVRWTSVQRERGRRLWAPAAENPELDE